LKRGFAPFPFFFLVYPSKDKGGRTLLHYAAYFGKLDAVMAAAPANIPFFNKLKFLFTG